MTIEGGLHDPALHAASAPMDEPHVAKPGVRGRCDVFLDDGGNIARGEGVQIELGFDGNANGPAPTGWVDAELKEIQENGALVRSFVRADSVSYISD